MTHRVDSSGRPEVLVCDDSHSERTAVCRLLRDRDYDVQEAADGEAAIVMLKHRQIDLVVLDLNMPQVDGFAVLTYLQEHRPSLPVVLLSGMALERIQHRIHKLPTQELPPLLIKPVDPEQLLAVMDMQLNGDLPDWDSAGSASVET